VTDADALECVKRAMGVTRIEIEALLSQGLPNTPMAGGFLRVTGGNFITARPVGVVDGIDFQYTGAVRKVMAEEIQADLAQENVVLITPDRYVSPSGEIFNLAWEEVAEAVAVAIKADKLIYLCDAPGMVDKQGPQAGSPLSPWTRPKTCSSGKRAPGPRRSNVCIAGAVRACRNGVGRTSTSLIVLPTVRC
jgi:amino-acid N-acetyltransferase